MIERTDADTLLLEMVCGKGGYVRAIARDLGRALGSLGHVLWLRREWSGPFAAKNGVTLARVEEMARSDALDALLLPLQAGLEGLTEVRATAEGAVRLRNGNPGQVVTGAEFGEEVWVSHQGQPVAIGIYRGGEVHPNRVFNL